MPASLTPGAQEVWRRLAPELVTMGVLSAVDDGLFATYCQACADFDTANAKLAAEGYTVDSPSGYPMQSPWLAIRKNAAREIARAAPEFGLSASSRTRVHTNPPRSPNPFAELSKAERFFGKGA